MTILCKIGTIDIITHQEQIFIKVQHSFHFKHTWSRLMFFKYIQALSKLRMSSHRLVIESGRWARPTSVPINERKMCTL